MTSRGVGQREATMVTSRMLGVFRDQPHTAGIPLSPFPWANHLISALRLAETARPLHSV
jgi:hypothetical protein